MRESRSELTTKTGQIGLVLEILTPVCPETEKQMMSFALIKIAVSLTAAAIASLTLLLEVSKA